MDFKNYIPIIKKSKNGFTLIEVIIACTIATIISAAIFTFFFTSNRGLNSTEAAVDLQKEGEVAMKCLTENLMALKKINSIPQKDSSTGNYISNLEFIAVKKNRNDAKVAKYKCTFKIVVDKVINGENFYKLNYEEEYDLSPADIASGRVTEQITQNDIVKDIISIEFKVKDKNFNILDVTQPDNKDKATGIEVILKLKKLKRYGSGNYVEKTFKSDIKFRNIN